MFAHFLAANHERDEFRHPLRIKNHEAGEFVAFLEIQDLPEVMQLSG